MLKFLMAALIAACSLISAPTSAAKIAPEAYAMRVPPAEVQGQAIHILVIDNRPYVLDGDSAETYEGMTREVYGIPISRNTADRTTMASYLGERIRIGFERAGYEATYTPSPKGSKPDARATEVANEAIDLIFVVDMREWSYDMGFAKPLFTYDVTVDVRDGAGNLLATQDFAAAEPMPTGGFKHFKRRYAELYQTIFDGIFAARGISDGLAGTPTISAPTETPSLTVEERIAKLRDMRAKGLIDEDAYERQQERILSEL